MLWRWLTIAASLPLLFATAASAASSDMFKGKTITYIVATSPGGGYDTYGRLIARFLPRYLTGARIVVKNMPGAGNIVGANAIYTARPDGLTIGMFNTGLIYDQLIGRPGVAFDLSKFSWLGKAASESRVLLVSSRSGFKSFADMLKTKGPIKFGASGVGAASYTDARILADAVQLNIQIINGFTGNSGEMSMLRGEIAAEVASMDALEPFVANGNGYFGLVLSGHDESLQNVPRVKDFVKDARSLPLLNLLEALSELGRLTAGPPGIPPAILDVERQALTAVMNDPEFRANAEKMDLPIDALPGDAVATRMKAALTQSRETVAALKRVAGGE